MLSMSLWSKLIFQDDSMTDEAIKQAEDELSEKSPTKVKRVPIAR